MTRVQRKADWRLKALLFLIALFGVGSLCIGLFLIPPGYLLLILHDRVFGQDFSSQKAIMTVDGADARIKGLPVAGGVGYFFGRLPSGPHHVRWTVDGYVPGDLPVVVAPWPNVPQTRIEAALKPDFGRLRIVGTDAVTGKVLTVPLEATLDARAGNSKGSEVLFPFATKGSHKVTVSAKGYCANTKDVVITPGSVAQVEMALSPQLKPDEVARFILNWDQGPDDVDAHVVAKLEGDLKEEHVYWSRKNFAKEGQDVVFLDIDMQHPGGFETVTIRKGFSGTFQYHLVNYSLLNAKRNHDPLPPALGDANAQIKLYTESDCNPRVFTVPRTCTKAVWQLVSIDVTQDGSVTVRPENQCVDAPRGQQLK